MTTGLRVLLTLFFFLASIAGGVSIAGKPSLSKGRLNELNNNYNSNAADKHKLRKPGGLHLERGPIAVLRYEDRIILQQTATGETVEIFIDGSRFNSDSDSDSAVAISVQHHEVMWRRNATKTSIEADAIFGFYELNHDHYLALVTKSDEAMVVDSHMIREVKEITLIHLRHRSAPLIASRVQQAAERLITSTFTRHAFYFCTSGYDVTRSYQYNRNIRSKVELPSWKSADSRFFWNENLLQPLFKMQKASESWITPIVNAWVGSKDLTINGRSMLISLISRRSRLRQGFRYIKRGSDESGEVANFAETEQLLEYIGSSGKNETVSFTQIRGSIPLFWKQSEKWKLRPKIVVTAPLEQQAQALKSHLVDLFASYSLPYITRSRYLHPKDPQVYFVNLIDKKGGQGILGRWFYAAFQQIISDNVPLLTGVRAQDGSQSDSQPLIELPSRVDRNKGLTDAKETTTEDFQCTVKDADMLLLSPRSTSTFGSPKFKVWSSWIWFDYHHKCKGGNVDSMKEIYTSLKRFFSRNCYFDPKNGNIQAGVIRTNCVDCLDRTNVVQSSIARWMLVKQLKALGIIKPEAIPDDTLALPDEDAERAFRALWCDNGDNLSLLYAGTKALKRDVTRFGKRTSQGAIDDGINSLMRFYINNNVDPLRQQGLDLILGNPQSSGHDDLPRRKLWEQISNREHADAQLPSTSVIIQGNGPKLKRKRMPVSGSRHRDQQWEYCGETAATQNLKYKEGVFNSSPKMPSIITGEVSDTFQSIEDIFDGILGETKAFIGGF